MSHKVTEEQSRLLEQLADAIFSGADAADVRRKSIAQCGHMLRNHRFPGSDWQSVKQQLAGLSSKLLVHSMHREARLLDQLVERLRRRLPDDEMRHNLLAFLLAASNSPVARWSGQAAADIPSDESDSERDKKPDPAKEGDIDWHALLTEGLELKSDYNEDSGSEWSSNEEADSDLNRAAEPEPPPQPPASGWTRQPNSWSPQRPASEQQPQQQQLQTECHLAFLRSHLQPEYWKDPGRGSVNVCHHGKSADSTASPAERWGQLRLDWQQLLLRSRGCVAAFGAARVEVTQYQAVRETLWMLSGARDSMLYTWELSTAPIVSVSGRACMPHLTDGALDRLLSDFATFGTTVARLRLLCEQLLGSNGAAVAPAMSALAGQLHADLLAPLQCYFLRLESESSLMRLRSALLPWQRAIAEAAALVNRVVWSDADAASHDPAAGVRLLDCLQRQAARANLTESPLYAGFATRAFRLCLRPLLEQLDRLLAGRPAPGLPFLPPLPADPPPETAYWLAPPPIVDRAVPQLLRPLLPELTSAAMSAHLLKAISERRNLPVLWRSVCQICEAAPLHQLLFSDNGEQKLQLPVQTLASYRCAPTLPDTEASRLQAESPLLWRSVQLLPPPMPPPPPPPRPKIEGGINDGDNSLTSAGMSASASRRVQSAIRDRCRQVNRLTVECLTGPKLRLIDFVSFAHNLFLMLDRDLLTPLCELLYAELRAGQPACDELALNLNLRACLLAGRSAQFANSVWLTLQSAAAQHSDSSADNVEPTDTGLTLIDSLRLNCEPPWPLGIVLTETALQVYAESFRWLLKLRCAKELLERLRFDGLRCADNAGQRYRVYSLRQQLLHLLTAFHQVSLHRLAAAAAQLPDRLSACQAGPDELRCVLNQFSARCAQVCLVSGSGAASTAPAAAASSLAATPRIRQMMSNLFRCSVVFSRRWSADQLTPGVVESLQAQLDSGRQFFATFVATFAKTGLAEHIEPLVSAMAS